jgi:hypothetical protein
MKKVLVKSWACADLKYNSKIYCYEHNDIRLGHFIMNDLKMLEIITLKHLQK